VKKPSPLQFCVGLGLVISIGVINYVLFALPSYDVRFGLPETTEVHTLGIMAWHETSLTMEGAMTSSFRKGPFAVSLALSILHLVLCLLIIWKLGNDQPTEGKAVGRFGSETGNMACPAIGECVSEKPESAGES
jgi:hypothetical protein